MPNDRREVYPILDVPASSLHPLARTLINIRPHNDHRAPGHAHPCVLDRQQLSETATINFGNADQ